LRKILALLLFGFSLGTSSAYAGNHSFKPGKLIDVSTDERLYEGTTLRRAIFVVQIDDVVYTLQGGRVSRGAKDYAQGLIVGDPVQASVEGKDVILQKPDGKDFKTSILKRERAKAN